MIFLPLFPATLDIPLAQDQFPEVPSIEQWESDAWYRLGLKLPTNAHPRLSKSQMTRYEAALAINQTIRVLRQKDGYSPLSPADYSFLNHQIALSKKEMRRFDISPSEMANALADSYKTTIGYTPTPAVTQTPDHHWAKISLDTLYKKGIFKGTPEG